MVGGIIEENYVKLTRLMDGPTAEIPPAKPPLSCWADAYGTVESAHLPADVGAHAHRYAGILREAQRALRGRFS